MLLQQLAQLQHLVSQQQQQPAVSSQQDRQQSPPARDAGTRRRGSRASGRDKGKLQQQLAKHLQQQRSGGQPLHVRQSVSAAQSGLSGISRVSSDLTQMLALSASGDSEGTTEEEEGRSVGWGE
jgi:hypothetical protein